jgi:hypothetical protein
MKLEFSQPFFEKFSNIKFNEILSSWSRDVSCRQTDRYGKANSRSSQFCERAAQIVVFTEFRSIADAL